MASSLAGRVVPAPVKRGVRRSLRWVARVRNTPAWPVVRPGVVLASRIVDVDRLLGRPAGANDPKRVAGAMEVLRRRLLNLGLTERALAELRALAADDSLPNRQRLAAWELALWHADQYDPAHATEALGYLQVAGRGDRDLVRRRRRAVIEAECHALAGDPAAARRVLEATLAAGETPDLLLAAANLEPERSGRVARINAALACFDLAPLRTAGAEGEPFDRLVAETVEPDPASEDGPLVSIIMPVHNSASTVGTALASVRAQSWTRWELLVVDDASTDHTVELVAECAARDARVRLIRARVNGGTYVARNLGLAEATGEFVTCHDADDWSHPEKLARQVRHLLANPEVVANTSQQVRATEDLRCHRRGKPGFYIFPNLSSLMFRRGEVVDALGAWDTVRFGADAELHRRLKREFGERAVVELATGPLCLQRQSSGSLTGSEAFGYHGYFMGARREYFEAYTHHHLRAAQTLRYEFPSPKRPFPVPAPMLPHRSPPKQRRHLDVVIASDFRLVGGSTMSSLEEVKAQQRLGLRTGLAPMYFYDADPRRSVTPRVRDVLDGDQTQMLVHGERISCDLLIVRYPPVLQDRHRFLPEIEAGDVRVIVNQPPMSDYGPAGVRRYRIPDCQQNLEHYFGQAGTWHPIGPLVRAALHQHHAADLPGIKLSDDDWVNIIDVAGWRRPARPERGERIRIGRHSRDHPMKWPHDPAQLREIYPDTARYEIHVLGGADAPAAVLGGLPENWRVHRFGHLSPAEFLAGIDVFVYFPNPDWVESFGRVILEAMAAGVPVVLPEQFRPLFGEAGLYAAPAEVTTLVDLLMADDDYYAARVDAGLRFAETGFGYSRHAERIGGLVRR